MQTEKRCPCCSETKSADEFYTAKNKSGLSSYCKSCTKAKARQRALDNPAATTEYRQQYRINNVERLKKLEKAAKDKRRDEIRLENRNRIRRYRATEKSA